MSRIQSLYLYFITAFGIFVGCTDDEPIIDNSIVGYSILEQINGHWVGENQTSFGFYDWFAFDFRPISESHSHSIYEGGTNQNIINSIFIADFEGEQQIMARNGGWLGNQYRATYFVLDIAEENENRNYYRLVDAVGKEKRAYIEFIFENDSLIFNAYKDNSGSLDEPVIHMQFKGTNANPSFAQNAVEVFDFPQKISTVNFENAFTDLIDNDSALFLEESKDPFPKSAHNYISDLKINFNKDVPINNEALLLYISKAPLVDANGHVDFENINSKVIRTITIQAEELNYTATYLHPDTYFITAFADLDDNFYPSSNDVCNVSKEIVVEVDSFVEVDINLNLTID